MGQVAKAKRGIPTRMAGLGPEVLKPRQVVILDKALMLLLYAFVAGRADGEYLFPTMTDVYWRRVMERLAVFFWVHHLQLVPRSLRSGGACHLHLDYAWPLPDLVIRGGWAKFESTHSYLQLGLYASIGLKLLPDLRDESRKKMEVFPRGLSLPKVLTRHFSDDIVERFRFLGGGPWGMESAARGSLGASPPPLRPGARWTRS